MTENEQVKEHLGLVIKIAKSFQPIDKAEMDDMIQEGSIALLKALRKHDAKRGKVSTLAWKYINKALSRYKKGIIENKEKHSDFESISDNSNQDKFWENIPDTLTQKELLVIQMKCEGYTFKEIGEKIGCTKSWSSRIFKDAIKKIKTANE